MCKYKCVCLVCVCICVCKFPLHCRLYDLKVTPKLTTFKKYLRGFTVPHNKILNVHLFRSDTSFYSVFTGIQIGTDLS